MGRMYSATFDQVAVTAAQDLFEINAPADAAVIVHGFEISQSSEFGDAADEQLILLAASFNVRAGYVQWWTPETRPVISPSGRLVIELQVAPADSVTMDGVVDFEEI